MINSELSPAAKAVMTACTDAPVHIDWATRFAAAAVIHAIADQVVPKEPEPRWWEPVRSRFNRQCIRHRLLAIADELEGTNG